MRILQNVSLRTRLIAGFGLTLALCAAGTVVALKEVQTIDQQVDAMVQDNVVKIQLNQRMSDAVHVEARVSRTLVLLDDPTQRSREIAKIQTARKAYDEAWSQLQALPGSARGLEIRRQTETSRQEARPLIDQVLQLAEADQDELATRVLMDQAGPAMQRWQDALAENIALQDAGLDRASEEVHSAMNLMKQTLILFGVLALASGIAIALLITRSAVAPLNAAVAFAGRIAKGDLTSRLDVQGRDEVAALRHAMRDMQAALSGIVAQVRDNATQLAAASEQIASGNQDLSQRTEQQASSLEQTAASMEELSATVRQNAGNAQATNALALEASQIARMGGQEVARVVETMKGISDSSRRIGEIINVIDGIAFQTNILALNAAVEAARAGEAGRGFAVVASEVRSLAARSASAAKEIKVLITESLSRVAEGNAQVDQAGQTMAQVVQAIERVSTTVGEISTASAEQTEGVMQIGQAITHLDQATQQNAALVEEMAAAAEKLNQQAEELVQAVSLFQLADATKARHVSAEPEQTATVVHRPQPTLPVTPRAKLVRARPPRLAAA